MLSTLLLRILLGILLVIVVAGVVLLLLLLMLGRWRVSSVERLLRDIPLTIGEVAINRGRGGVLVPKRPALAHLLGGGRSKEGAETEPAIAGDVEEGRGGGGRGRGAGIGPRPKRRAGGLGMHRRVLGVSGGDGGELFSGMSAVGASPSRALGAPPTGLSHHRRVNVALRFTTTVYSLVDGVL